jgi:hypothetical protein
MTSESHSVNGLANCVSMVSTAFAGSALTAGSYRMSWDETSNMAVPG